jgi:beta-galactosidase
MQTTSTVWWNGQLLGSHTSGYSPSRYFLPSLPAADADNVLAVYVDATKPDSWWYDGGGIYRHVWLNTASSVYLGPDGTYVPSAVTGSIDWTAPSGPTADAVVAPSVEVWSNATGSTPFNVTVAVLDAAGTVVGGAQGFGTVAGGSVTTWAAPNISLHNAALWHLVEPPHTPALYTLRTTLSIAGTVAGTANVTFGVRATHWDADTGFYLNGRPTKILGTANHENFAAVGVGVPDALQRHRVGKLKEFSVNGWRCAHGLHTPALLDAADRLGVLVWDETHRNGQPDEATAMVRRDRNHPSVIIWSICNERLCTTANETGDALVMKAAIKAADPWPAFAQGGRPVCANYNNWSGKKDTPLDIQVRSGTAVLGHAGFECAVTRACHDGAAGACPLDALVPSVSSSP